MTLLSNHRIHSYKASASHIRRDVSPKKVPQQKVPFMKKTRDEKAKALGKLLWTIKLKMAEPAILCATPSPDCFVIPEPSAPPAIMTTRTIYVWGMEYNVEIPRDFDIYEGLRLWYPQLYKAVKDEEQHLNELRAMEEGLTEDEVERAWAHQDYLEWLCD